MKYNKKKLIISIIFLLLSVIFVGISFMPSIYSNKATLNNTTVIQVTLSSIEIKDDSCIINTEEYGSKLIVRNLEEFIDKESISDIPPKTILFVGIDNSKLDNIESSSFIFIVSLETEAKGLITLDSHNMIIEKSEKTIQITSIVFSIIFFIIALSCFIIYKKNAHKTL